METNKTYQNKLKKKANSSLNVLGGLFLLIAAPIHSATNKKVGLFGGWG